MGGVDRRDIGGRWSPGPGAGLGFRAGTNWIHGMQTGTGGAVRTIAVLSHDYLKSAYGQAEW
jgi:hypothetical protein